MRLRTALLGLGTSLVVVLSACGNGPPPESDSSSSSVTGGGGGGGALVTGATGAAAKTVNESDALKFDPATISVKVGDIVEWDNAGSAVHNVTFDEGTKSSDMSSGDKFTVQFKTAGSYKYKCTFHPGMEGTVTVG